MMVSMHTGLRSRSRGAQGAWRSPTARARGVACAWSDVAGLRFAGHAVGSLCCCSDSSLRWACARLSVPRSRSTRGRTWPSGMPRCASATCGCNPSISIRRWPMRWQRHRCSCRTTSPIPAPSMAGRSPASAVTDAVVWSYPEPRRIAVAGRVPILLLGVLAQPWSTAGRTTWRAPGGAAGAIPGRARPQRDCARCADHDRHSRGAPEPGNALCPGAVPAQRAGPPEAVAAIGRVRRSGRAGTACQGVGADARARDGAAVADRGLGGETHTATGARRRRRSHRCGGCCGRGCPLGRLWLRGGMGRGMATPGTRRDARPDLSFAQRTLRTRAPDVCPGAGEQPRMVVVLPAGARRQDATAHAPVGRRSPCRRPGPRCEQRASRAQDSYR